MAEACDAELNVLALGSKIMITKARETPETQRIQRLVSDAVVRMSARKVTTRRSELSLQLGITLYSYLDRRINMKHCIITPKTRDKTLSPRNR